MLISSLILKKKLTPAGKVSEAKLNARSVASRPKNKNSRYIDPKILFVLFALLLLASF